VSGWRSFRPSTALLAPLVFAACATPAVPTPECSRQILVTLAEPTAATAGPELAARIARSAEIGLEFVRSVGPNVFVFTLTDTASDANCEQALTRLRSDPRIRSAELDAARKRHGS